MPDELPPSNMQQASIPWARRIENAVRQNGRSLDVMYGNSQDGNRYLAGQLGSLTGLLEEVEARGTEFIDLGSLTNTFLVPGGTPTNPGPIVSATITQNYPIPAPADGGPRRPIIFFTGNGYSSGNFSGLLGTHDVSANGISDRFFAPAAGSAPPDWYETVSMMIVGSVGQSELTISIRTETGFNSGAAKTVTGGLDQMRMVITYGGEE